MIAVPERSEALWTSYIFTYNPVGSSQYLNVYSKYQNARGKFVASVVDMCVTGGQPFSVGQGHTQIEDRVSVSSAYLSVV